MLIDPFAYRGMEFRSCPTFRFIRVSRKSYSALIKLPIPDDLNFRTFILTL